MTNVVEGKVAEIYTREVKLNADFRLIVDYLIQTDDTYTRFDVLIGKKQFNGSFRSSRPGVCKLTLPKSCLASFGVRANANDLIKLFRELADKIEQNMDEINEHR